MKIDNSSIVATCRHLIPVALVHCPYYRTSNRTDWYETVHGGFVKHFCPRPHTAGNTLPSCQYRSWILKFSDTELCLSRYLGHSEQLETSFIGHHCCEVAPVCITDYKPDQGTDYKANTWMRIPVSSEVCGRSPR